MVVGEAHVFPGFLTLVLTQLFFPKPPTTFLTCFFRGERRKYAGKKSHPNRGSNSQPPSHESDTLTTVPPGRGGFRWWKLMKSRLARPDGTYKLDYLVQDFLQNKYMVTIDRKVLGLVFQIFLNLEAFEGNTNSAWICVLLSNLQNLGEKDQECSWEWYFTTNANLNLCLLFYFIHSQY